jgi:hypothetical protein
MATGRDMICFDVMLGAARIREHIDRGRGVIQYILDGEIFVPNLSFNKSVGFRVNVDGNWNDIYTSYSRSLLTCNGNSVEVWRTKEFGELIKEISVTTPIPPKPVFQLAVFYHDLDSGARYWDSKGGQNYFVQTI